MFLELQLNYLLWLQNLRTATDDFFTPLFLEITKCGEYFIPVLACSLIYWCIDKKLGVLIILSSATGLMVNHLLKNIACIYRPWMLDSRIKPVEQALHHAGGYSFPSGHSSLAVSCWGAIGLWYRKHKKILILAVLLCLLVAFSRNYLGVHTPQDIIIGLLTSLITLIIMYKLLNWCEDGKNRDLVLTVIISLISILITVYTYVKSYPIDYDSTGKMLMDINKSKIEALPKLGFVLGAFWGWYVENRFICFDTTTGSIKEKTFRAVIGIILLFLTIRISLIWKDCYGIAWGGFIFMITTSLFITLIYPWLIKMYTKKHYLRIGR